MVLKQIANGALLYGAAATIGMLFFLGQYRVQKHEARSNAEALYNVCRSVDVLRPARFPYALICGA